MEDLLDFLLQNPWLLLLVIMGVLGNLGSSAAKQRQRRTARRAPPPKPRPQPRPEPLDPWDEPVLDEAEPIPGPTDADEISRRIREMLGGRPEPSPQQAPPRPAPPVRTRRASERTGVGPAAGFGDLGDGLREAGSGLETTIEQLLQPPSRRTRTAARPLAFGSTPRDAVRAIVILGRPRALAVWDDDPSRWPA